MITGKRTEVTTHVHPEVTTTPPAAPKATPPAAPAKSPAPAAVFSAEKAPVAARAAQTPPVMHASVQAKAAAFTNFVNTSEQVAHDQLADQIVDAQNNIKQLLGELADRRLDGDAEQATLDALHSAQSCLQQALQAPDPKSVLQKLVNALPDLPVPNGVPDPKQVLQDLVGALSAVPDPRDIIQKQLDGVNSQIDDTNQMLGFTQMGEDNIKKVLAGYNADLTKLQQKLWPGADPALGMRAIDDPNKPLTQAQSDLIAKIGQENTQLGLTNTNLALLQQVQRNLPSQPSPEQVAAIAIFAPWMLPAIAARQVTADMIQSQIDTLSDQAVTLSNQVIADQRALEASNDGDTFKQESLSDLTPKLVAKLTLKTSTAALVLASSHRKPVKKQTN